MLLIEKERIIYLNVPVFFSWNEIITYLSRATNEIIYRIIENKIRRVFTVSSINYLCEIAYLKETKEIEIILLSPSSWNDLSKKKISEFINEWFDLKTDLKAFYKMCYTDSLLCELPNEYKGLRLIGMPDFYEAITWGILGQQINLNYAYTLKRRFIESYGERISFEGTDYWVYPTAENISRESYDDILKLKLTKKKAEYLIDISQRIATGELSKKIVSECDNVEDAEKQLTQLRGIGTWTANYVLMRCLHVGNAFPMNDAVLLNGIKVLKNDKNKPKISEMKILKDRWGLWCGYATFYIWRSLF